jgi:hypothetical protein
MPGSWSGYMKQLQRMTREQKQSFLNPEDLTVYVNRARREVAMRSMCIRVFPPISGSLASTSITAHGTGYTAPTVSITPPDFPSGMLPYPGGLQATATATQVGGTISSVSITLAGSGYFQPLFVINDPTGTGATVTAQTTPINTLNQGQEVYPFADIPISSFPGIESIFSIRSVNIIYANYRYSIPIYSMSIYKAYIANYPNQYQYVPTMGAQYGRGASGSFYLYPIASQTYQLEFDCMCLPIDLTSDEDEEAIPDPYTDGVPFLAAYYAMMDAQNAKMATFYKGEFDEWIKRYGRATLPGRLTNPYGRW